jgi:HlyD family secretion protein
VIAQVDPAPFEAALHQAEAELAVARANVTVQRASSQELAAEMAGRQSAAKQAEDELDRKRELLKRKVETASVVDAAQSRYEQTRSELEATRARIAKQQAQVEIALAQVQQRSAAVEQRQLELAHTSIRAPVDGVVISRNVDPGQTVAASLQSPILFTIAGDLTRLQLAISVDEADIGVVKPGQRVVFVVDAYPGRRFSGQVQQIRKASREISNVVTYTVIASTENADGSLLPGMTATVSIVTAERDDALLVPNAARRLQLPVAFGGHPGLRDWVWVQHDDGSVEALPVAFGISDGNETEIVSDGLAAGQNVVVGLVPAAPAESRNWLRLGF